MADRRLEYVLPLKYVLPLRCVVRRSKYAYSLIGHSLVVSPFICNTLFHWSNSQSLSNDNQATKFIGALTLLEAMLSTVKLRVQQEVNIYQFEVHNIYCQLKEIMIV